MCIAVSLVLALALATSIGCAGGRCRGDNGPIPYNSRLIQLPRYTANAMRQPSSPQAKAYNWLLSSYSDESLLRMTSFEKMQKYAMATIFYALNGETWGYEWTDLFVILLD